MSQPVKPLVKEDLQKRFKKGLQTLALEANEQQITKCIDYLELMHKWNQRLNLTAIRNPIEMVSRHLLDSLAIYPHLVGQRMIDVGTGAGLPGIPLSIMAPQCQFFLLDSNHKKQVFVNQVVKSLSLTNVSCVHSEVGAYQPTEKFSTILTRAFAPLEHMIPLTSHLLAQEGRFLAMMGKVEQNSLSTPQGFEIENIISLKVPGEEGERHLAIISKI